MIERSIKGHVFDSSITTRACSIFADLILLPNVSALLPEAGSAPYAFP